MNARSFTPAAVLRLVCLLVRVAGPAVLVGLIGCGGGVSSPHPQADNGDPGQNPEPTPAKSEEAGDSLVAYVATPDGTAARPIAGASVTLESPAISAASTVTSEADGRVVFPHVDFSHGSVTLTAFQDGYVMGSLVGISSARLSKSSLSYPQADRAPVLVLERRAASTTTAAAAAVNNSADCVTLSGTIKGKSAADNVLTISSADGGVFRDKTATYNVSVAKGQPIVLVGLECADLRSTQGEDSKLRWVRWEMPAISENTTIDLDLATASVLTPTRTNLTMKMAAGTSASPFWTVRGAPLSNLLKKGFFLGSQDRAEQLDELGTRYSSLGEYVSIGSDYVEPHFEANFPGVNGETSQVVMTSVPTSGVAIDFLPFAPTPQATRLGNDIPLDALTTPIDPRVDQVSILVADKVGPDGTLLWVISTPQKAEGQPLPKALAIPQLQPAARALLPTGLAARLAVSAFQGQTEHPEPGKYLATGRFFSLDR